MMIMMMNDNKPQLINACNLSDWINCDIMHYILYFWETSYLSTFEGACLETFLCLFLGLVLKERVTLEASELLIKVFFRLWFFSFSDVGLTNTSDVSLSDIFLRSTLELS